MKVPAGTEQTEYKPIKFGSEEKTLETTMPFVKGNEFSYSDILFWMDAQDRPVWAVASIFIFAAKSDVVIRRGIKAKLNIFSRNFINREPLIL